MFKKDGINVQWTSRFVEKEKLLEKGETQLEGGQEIVKERKH